jgi:hypothetical protein
MGSFQQISIGTVCLVAAFMFGNYVNNHPHPDQVTNALTELESDVNPVAKTSLIEPGKIIQRSAPMATMKSKPAARYPQMSLFKGTIKNGFDGSATEASSNPLPPPSQLGASSPFENNLEQRLVGQANKIRRIPIREWARKRSRGPTRFQRCQTCLSHRSGEKSLCQISRNSHQAFETHRSLCQDTIAPGQLQK